MTNPKYKETMDALIDNPNPELKDIIQPVIEEELKKARMIGVNIGFQGAMLQIYKNIEDIKTAKDIKKYIRNEVNRIREKMQNDPVFDENGKIIVENDEKDNE